jgi:ribosomal protein L32
MDALNQTLGPLTMLQWFLALGGLMVVFSIFNALSRRAKEAKGDDDTVRAKCLVCGWNGKVSRFHRTCPKCGNSITRMSKNER